jgi:hypothetical protein
MISIATSFLGSSKIKIIVMKRILLSLLILTIILSCFPLIMLWKNI